MPDPPATGGPHSLWVNVTLDPDGLIRGQYPPGDCRAVNDFAPEMEWKIVKTRNLDLKWCKVGRLIETSSMARDRWVDDLDALGTGYIHGTFPVAAVSSGRCLGGMLAPINNALLDIVATVLAPIGIPLDAVIPFVMVWEFNDMAVLAGYDRLMGVLPDPGFFDRLSYGWWSSIGGLSLGEFAPHAVIFLPINQDDDTGESGPNLKVPAHEVGHTFGMSVDRKLKDEVWCGLDLPGDMDSIVCGATGGLDEYKSSDPFRARGNPATGFWLAQGGEDPRIAALTGAEQCGSHCMMGGGSGFSQHLHWGNRGRRIDKEDWEHLVHQLAAHPDPELLYVSGLIDAADNAAFGPWFRIPSGVPDRIQDDIEGIYGLVFYDFNGVALQVVSLPVHFGASDMPIVPPVTFFGFTVPWPADTGEIQLWRWDTQSLLASRQVSPNPPTVALAALPPGLVLEQGDILPLDWTGDDPDNDELYYYLMLSGTGGQTWEPLTGPLSVPFVDLDTSVLAPGFYTFKVVVTDGIHRADSSQSPFVQIIPGTIFSDGFESGSTGAWSAAVP